MSNIVIKLVDPKDDTDAQIAFRLMKKWSKDYNRDDKRGAKRQTLKEVRQSCKTMPQKYIFLFNEKDENIGIVAMKNQFCIDVIYILPEHRGKGYATEVYKELQTLSIIHPDAPDYELRPVSVCIDIDRVDTRIDYWKNLGYEYFHKTGNNLIEIFHSPERNLAQESPLAFAKIDMMSLASYKSTQSPV